MVPAEPETEEEVEEEDPEEEEELLLLVEEIPEVTEVAKPTAGEPLCE